ncbi:MAG: hypothetical protein SCARUB_01763 [Candidatus Scalindua rubra]|uniref:Uncharacterized protein n=1 Tax=Candidatus Scalindua rubra TaxID=1872076 RepID=A0A1E3XC12_9BACT|nr:MAG: hypothetical protein SCARUB_01763 [Candidatus Scalindua rubra]
MLNYLTLIWTGIFAFIVCLNQISIASEKENHKEKYVVINNLVVNNKNKFRTIIYKNEEEGILEMRKLINTSEIEESWTFLPHQEKWIEIGINEESERKINGNYITKTGLDVQLLDELIIGNKDMVVYHFHPSHSLHLEDEIKERNEKGLTMNDQEIEKEKIKFLIKSAYPSKSDLMNMIGNSIEFFEKNPNGNITFKIGSYYGITEYYLTEEGRTYFNTNNSFEQMSRITKASSSANLEANVTGEILELNPRQKINPLSRIKMSPKQKRKPSSRFKKIYPLSRVKKSVETMNDEYLRVAFTPYE